MALVVLGVNHATAPVALREKLAFPANEVGRALRALVDGNTCITEAVILSTCNRTEVYANTHAAHVGKEALTEFLLTSSSLEKSQTADLEGRLYFHHGKACVRHLFRVVSSLDSLVLGEAQILGQVRTAFQHAEAADTAGPVFTRLFRQALKVGKRVRTETSIGQQATSVSTVAASLALKAAPKLEGGTVLVVGAGQMAELVATYLAEKDISRINVANRSLERARTLAQRFGGRAFPLDELDEAIASCDVVISSTGAPGYVIDKPLVERAQVKRRKSLSGTQSEQIADGDRNANDTPLLLIDIALPRNVDPRCAEVEGVTCVDLDSLTHMADQGKRERQREAVNAERIVDEETTRFLTWMQQETVTPTIKDMYGKAGGICQREVAHAIRELAKAQDAPVDSEQQAVLEALANAVAKKILHGPVVRMRKQASNPDAYLYTETARFLFGLDSNPQGLPCAGNPGKCHIDGHGTCRFAEAGTCPFGRTIPQS